MITQAGERRLDLPPGYTLVALREHADAFEHALHAAAEAGAGTLFRVGRYDLIEFALVLEPDEKLSSSRRALFVGMNALGDAISALCPPERPVSFGWPDAVFFDGALIGGIRLGWPRGCAEDEVPDWLVLGVMLRRAGEGEVSLVGDGFDEGGTEPIVSGFARHLMKGFDQWSEAGFDAVASTYLARLQPVSEQGRRLAGNGDLLLGSDTAPLAPGKALARPSWLDADSKNPRYG
jgi:hypothetical protein